MKKYSILLLVAALLLSLAACGAVPGEEISQPAAAPTTLAPTTLAPTTMAPTTTAPTTAAPTTATTTTAPTVTMPPSVPAALQWLYSGAYSQALIDELTAEWTAAQLPTDTGEEKLAFFKLSFSWRNRLADALPDFNNQVPIGDRAYCALLNSENYPTFEALQKVTEWYFTPDYAANRIADQGLFEHEGQVWMEGEGKGDAADWQNATLVSAESDAIVIRVKILACGEDGIYPEECYRVTFQNGKVAGWDCIE